MDRDIFKGGSSSSRGGSGSGNSRRHRGGSAWNNDASSPPTAHFRDWVWLLFCGVVFVVGRLGEEDDVIESLRKWFQGKRFFRFGRKGGRAEGGIDGQEDWVWIWDSCYSWGLEDGVRAGLLGRTLLVFTLSFLLRGLLRRNLGRIEYIGLLPLVCSIYCACVRMRPLLMARANPGIL